MKKLFTISLLLLSYSGIQAQWAFTDADFPATGDSAFYRIADTTGVTPGSSGTSMAWDFSFLTPTGSTVVSRFKTPSTVTGGASFPEATTAENPSNTDYDFYRVTTDSLFQIGEKSNVNTTIDYTDPLLAMLFPFNYLDQINDSIKALYPDGFISQVDRKGSVHTVYDGAGSLTTPAMSYSNVIRIHRTYSIVDSSLTGLATAYTSTEEYLWYENGTRHPVLRYWKQNTVLNGSPQNIFDVWYSDVFATSTEGAIHPSRLVVATYPNPATDVLTLKYLTGLNAEVTATITALDGKVVRSISAGVQNQGTHELTVDVRDFAPGVYVVKLVAGENTVSRQFVVQ